MSNRILVDIIHEGDCEQRFRSCHIVLESDSIDVDEMAARAQAALDAWREGHPDECDEFGSGRKDLTVEEVVELLPAEFSPTVVSHPVRSLFV